jgi:hypothetical protein
MDRDYYGHNEERWQQQYQTSQESRFPLPTGYPLEPRIDQFNQQNVANLYAALNTVPSQTTPAIQPPFQWHGTLSFLKTGVASLTYSRALLPSR